jgi:ferritin heavy chain
MSSKTPTQQTPSQVPPSKTPTINPVLSNVSICVNFDDQTVEWLNKLANQFLTTSYACTSMHYFWNRDSVGMYGFAQFCRFYSLANMRIARIIMDYINGRGGAVELSNITLPSTQEWTSPTVCLEEVLELNKSLQEQVLEVHRIADKHNDEHTKNYLESEILEPVIVLARKIGVLLTNVQRAGTGVGEYQVNKDLHVYFNQFIGESKIRNWLDFPVVQPGLAQPGLIQPGLVQPTLFNSHLGSPSVKDLMSRILF